MLYTVLKKLIYFVSRYHPTRWQALLWPSGKIARHVGNGLKSSTNLLLSLKAFSRTTFSGSDSPESDSQVGSLELDVQLWPHALAVVNYKCRSTSFNVLHHGYPSLGDNNPSPLAKKNSRVPPWWRISHRGGGRWQSQVAPSTVMRVAAHCHALT